MGTLIVQAIRILFFKIDEAIYNFITSVYGLLLEISDATFLTQDVLNVFFDRIYGLLGIFMLFKVSFSILTYIVNPDGLDDKSKGFPKLISNIIITLALLIFVPYVFKAAFQLQNIIIREEMIGKIVLGTSSPKDDFNSYGHMLSFETLRAFYYVDEEDYEGACKGIYEENFDSPDCSNIIGADVVNKVRQTYQNYDVKSYLDLDLITAKATNGQFAMNYTLILSTAAGVVVLFTLMSFCFDVALRSVKLGFLQLIAPVPIISRIDPKKGKEVFDKWVKSCITTYLDLFIRLLAIYFAVFVITLVIRNGAIVNSSNEAVAVSSLVKVFIILGALLFAKELPKLLSDIFGFDMKGKFSLNPMKKLKEVPGAEKVASTAGGIMSGAIAGSRVANPLLGAALGGMKGFNSAKLMGDGKGGFMQGANSAFKQLMGKDFLNLQFKPGGKGYLGDLKDAKGKLIDAQNQIQSKLTAATSRTGASAKTLMENGVDLENLDAARTQAEQNINQYQSQYSSAQQDLAQLRAAASGTRSQTKRAEFERQILDKEREIGSIQSAITKSQEIVSSVDNYKKALADEKVFREALGQVQKDLETVSTQKKQVENFYGQDPSPTGDVQEAAKNATAGVDNYVQKAKSKVDGNN